MAQVSDSLAPGGGGADLGATVTAESLRETLATLTAFYPDLRKKLDAEIHDTMQMVADTAQRRVEPHPSGLVMELAAAGYLVRKVKARNEFSVGYSAVNTTKPGAIAEFAGKRNPEGETPQGKSLIATLTDIYGKPGRLLWGSWDDLRDYGLERVTKAAEEAEAECNVRLNARLGV